MIKTGSSLSTKSLSLLLRPMVEVSSLDESLMKQTSRRVVSRDSEACRRGSTSRKHTSMPRAENQPLIAEVKGPRRPAIGGPDRDLITDLIADSTEKRSKQQRTAPQQRAAQLTLSSPTALLSSAPEWQAQFFKTKLCPLFVSDIKDSEESLQYGANVGNASGVCLSGESCRFAHSLEELRPLPDLRKTKLCSSYSKRVACKNSKCPFAHSPRELRTSSSVFYKVTLCNFYKNGRCWNGSNCRFAHGNDELRNSDLPHPPAAPSKNRCNRSDRPPTAPFEQNQGLLPTPPPPPTSAAERPDSAPTSLWMYPNTTSLEQYNGLLSIVNDTRVVPSRTTLNAAKSLYDDLFAGNSLNDDHPMFGLSSRLDNRLQPKPADPAGDLYAEKNTSNLAEKNTSSLAEKLLTKMARPFPDTATNLFNNPFGSGSLFGAATDITRLNTEIYGEERSDLLATGSCCGGESVFESYHEGPPSYQTSAFGSPPYSLKALSKANHNLADTLTSIFREGCCSPPTGGGDNLYDPTQALVSLLLSSRDIQPTFSQTTTTSSQNETPNTLETHPYLATPSDDNASTAPFGGVFAALSESITNGSPRPAPHEDALQMLLRFVTEED